MKLLITLVLGKQFMTEKNMFKNGFPTLTKKHPRLSLIHNLNS